MYTCNKKLHFSRTSVPDLISIKRPVVNGQITVQNWSISTTEAVASALTLLDPFFPWQFRLALVVPLFPCYLLSFSYMGGTTNGLETTPMKNSAITDWDAERKRLEGEDEK